MLIEIPVLIESVRNEDETNPGKLFLIRPVFFDRPEILNKNLDSGLQGMSSEIHKRLRSLFEREEIEEIVKISFSPELKLRRVEIAVDLPRRFARMTLPVVEFESEDRMIGFCPLLEAPPFEFSRSDDFSARVGAVYRDYFRAFQKKQGDPALNELLKPLERSRNFRLAEIECSVEPVRRARRDRDRSDRQREILDAGRDHLEQTGTCLDRLLQKKNSQAVCRDELRERIYRLLTDPQRNAVLLVGPSKVGKTAIIHSVVSMMTRRLERPRHDPRRGEVWQLAPGRLIAGMSLSGQWESRLQGIFAYAAEKDLTLNFLQLVALLNTGKSAQGNLSMADLLLPALRRRRFRVVAEMTDEQLRVFRERNRSLADQFEIVHVSEPTPEETMRILLHTAREFEWNWKCSFDIDLFPLLFDITRQYESDAAMPGKAVQWLGSLAMQFQGETIDREKFLELFRDKSGLRLSFFDDGKKQDTPEEIDQWFQDRIIGQREAVTAMRDVIVLAESLPADPERPIASLFFTGPTGVGKTECAKQLARYFFGGEDRLLRFDANELCTAQAVARLVGSHQNGEGLLTGAVRRQPFSVILFDEIEKGHPDLFDLLLQVIGEARLTDTQGRVASFAQSIVIFTSNLGARDVSARTGFGQNAAADHGWKKAIRDFFRPEFVNRIDRIVPFTFLSPNELVRIADRMIGEIINREGLRRRKARLLITGAARQRITSYRTDPVYGARGMRRTLERELVAPLSGFLASTDSRNPAVIEVTGHEGLQIRGYELIDAEKPRDGVRLNADRIDSFSKEKRIEILSVSKTVLAGMRENFLPLRPSGRFDATDIAQMAGTERLYFRLNEEHAELRQELDELLEFERTNKPRVSPNLSAPHVSLGERGGGGYEGITSWKRLASNTDLKTALDELFADRRRENRGSRFSAFLKRLARLHEAVSAIRKEPEKIAVLNLEAGLEAGDLPPDTDAGPVTLLETAWQRHTVSFDTDAEIAGWTDRDATVWQGPGTADCWKRFEGSTLMFRGDALSVRARLVLDVPDDDSGLREAVLRRLTHPTEKWPPVTAVSRIQGGETETVRLHDPRFSLPEPLHDIL